MAAIERAFLRALDGLGLAPSGSRGILCVSGGADSVGLLHLMLRARKGRGLTLEVLHFHHGLRPEAEQEAARVEAWAGAADVPCHVRRAGHLSALTHGVQAAARAWRRQEALRLMDEVGADWIATGHQRDDQAETLLLKLLRGAHVTHLQGMAWREGPFIRPLLAIRHEALRRYLAAREIPWMEDPSNTDPKYLRNRVRHEALPLLRELAGGRLEERLERLAAQAAHVAELLAAQPRPEQSEAGAAEPWIAVAGLNDLEPLGRCAALHEFVQAQGGGEAAAAALERASELIGRDAARWEVVLAGGRRLVRRGRRIMLRAGAAPEAKWSTREAAGLRITAPAQLDWTVHVGMCEGGLVVHGLPPGAQVRLRPRREGDRFHPPWRQRTVKLKDFLRDQGVPAEERDGLMCAEWEGRLVAVEPRFAAKGHHLPAAEGKPVCFHWTATALDNGGAGDRSVEESARGRGQYLAGHEK